MFYFLLAPILMYNWVLIAASVVPAVFLMIKVYRSDRLEKENPALLKSLVGAGVLSTFLALLEERIGNSILSLVVEPGTTLYNVLLYFVIVALSEESSKYVFLKRKTWANREFNCQYDGVVYAVFVSLGFALWENVSYVLHYGLTSAIIRALTAIPGHACFGVFMGVFYGISRANAFVGKQKASKFYRALSLIVPVLLHGAYDYIASQQEAGSGWYFVFFVVLLFALSFYLVSKTSKNDKYFSMDRLTDVEWEIIE